MPQSPCTPVSEVDLATLDSDPHPALAAMRARSPVTWVPAVGGWLVTGYDAAVAVMRDAATYTVADPRFSTGRVVGPSMLSTDGAEHARHRGPFTAPFRPAKVQQRYGDRVSSLADGLVDRIRPAGRAELRSTVAGPLSVAVVSELLGIGGERGVDADTVLRWYAAIVAAVSDGGEPTPASQAAIGELGAQVRAGVGGDGLLAAAGERLDPEELVSDAAVLLFGGVETTEGMILSAVGHLLDSPSHLDRARCQPDLLTAVVEESLRLEPAAAVVDRYATRDVTLAEVPVRRGDLVRVSLAGANRDPATFADPDRFDPDRPGLRAQLAFARGPHVCVAMDLARLEARTALSALLTLPGLALAEPVRASGVVFRRPATVRVTWDAPVASPGDGLADRTRT